MTRRISRIERVGDGIRVTLGDGTSTTYANAAQVPDEISQLIARMDSAGAPAGDADARDAYRRRLERAHLQDKPPEPDRGLQGRELYESRLRDGWTQPAARKGIARKYWTGA